MMTYLPLDGYPSGFLPSRAAQPVLVVGDGMLDRYWDGQVDRISPEAPVPVLSMHHEWQRAGGAANVAANLASLGSVSTLVTWLGGDAAGDQLSGLIEAAGVTLKAVRSPQATTTQKIRAVCSHHQLLRVDIEQPIPPDALQALCALVAELLPQHPWVVLSDYHKGVLAQCDQLLQQARRQGCQVLVDPKGSCFDQYAGAWLLKPNEKEAAAVTGSWSDDTEFASLMEALRARLRLEHLLVTRGSRGMSLFSAGQPAVHIASAAHEVFDVSGAGDTVLAALAACLAAGEPLHDAVRGANAAAGLAVAKFGTAVVTEAELLQARAQTARKARLPAH